MRGREIMEFVASVLTLAFIAFLFWIVLVLASGWTP